MIYIGLSGNRYSGKDRIAKLFKQIHIPVFEADLVLRFAMHYNIEILNKIRNEWGPYYFNDNGSINFKRVGDDNKFGKLVKYFEDDIIQAYYRFNKKNKNSIYTIFHSSILFEAGWDVKMCKNITIFTPLRDRVDRCRFLTNYQTSEIYDLYKGEMPGYLKNNKSDFVIHNYDNGSCDVLNSVCDIDQKIIDSYIYNKIVVNSNEEY